MAVVRSALPHIGQVSVSLVGVAGGATGWASEISFSEEIGAMAPQH